MDERRPSGDMMASLAEEFMTDWTSNIFRDRCLAQIESAKLTAWPQGYSDDPVESFLTGKTCRELEEFIFSSAGTREDYLSLIAEILMMYRKRRGHPAVDTETLESASPEDLVQGGMFGADNLVIPEETLDQVRAAEMTYTTEAYTTEDITTSYTTTATTNEEEEIAPTEISNGIENMKIETKKEVKSTKKSASPTKSPTKGASKASPRKEVPNGVHENKEKSKAKKK